ncbi:MAG: hypothetical protein HC865_12630 [Cyanobacteria bacterium RU_5_0]|nr:hypothetical protein [Cyanobacteria bacterium RU_5_0]
MQCHSIDRFCTIRTEQHKQFCQQNLFVPIRFEAALLHLPFFAKRDTAASAIDLGIVTVNSITTKLAVRISSATAKRLKSLEYILKL